jgi:hypothetical protein
MIFYDEIERLDQRTQFGMVGRSSPRSSVCCVRRVAAAGGSQATKDAGHMRGDHDGHVAVLCANGGP